MKSVEDFWSQVGRKIDPGNVVVHIEGRIRYPDPAMSDEEVMKEEGELSLFEHLARKAGVTQFFCPEGTRSPQAEH